MSNFLLTRLVAASVQVSQRAAKIIREIKQSGSLDTQEKAKNDYVTKADFQSQMCIIRSLEAQFPKLRFCGEEGELNGEFNDLDTSLNPEVVQILNNSQFETKCPNYTNIKEEDLFVWIDPLDGTREYTLGEEYAHEVTILIGISYKGQPIAGIVNQPFYTRSISDPNGDRVIWGINGLGAYQNGNSNRVFQKLEPPKPKSDDRKFRIITTRSHITELLRTSLTSIPNSEVLFNGGSGYKTLCVIEGSADCYLYPRNGTKRWDTCAPEAILRSVGGEFTDVFNHPYDYSRPTGDDVENTTGIVASSISHDYFLKHLSQELLDSVLPAKL